MLLACVQNPHTGYSITGPIAAAAISNEDASQLQRFQDRGQTVTVSMYMDNIQYPDSPSRNLLIDLVGSRYPDEYGTLILGFYMLCAH